MRLPFFQPSTSKPWANSNSIEFVRTSSQYLNFGNNIADDYNTAVSWSFWYRPNTLPTQSSVISKITTSPFNGYVIDITNAGKLQIYYGHNASNNYLEVTQTTGTITTGNWYHCVVTKDTTGLAAGVVLYINGSSVAFTTNSNTLSATITNSVSMVMGADQEVVGFEDYIDGYLAQVSHWNVVLTGAQVTTLYNSGTPVNPLTQSFGSGCDHFWPLGTPNDTIASSGILDRVGSVNGSPVNTPTITTTVP